MIRLSLQKRLHAAHGEMTLALDMHIQAGEFVTVFGKSGSGKTTLLRMLAGLTAPDSGRIEVAGEVWYDSAANINRPPQARRAGLVFQDYALFPHLTVRKNLSFALPKGGDAAEVEEILDIIGLRALEHRLPESLSGGQKQRVALARALVSRPKILLLDEPLSALDMDMRLRLQEEIAAVQRRFAIATLLVSHDLAEIFRLSQRIYCLEDGRIVRSGEPGAVFTGERLSGKFRFTGILLEKHRSDAVFVLTVLVGSDIVKVTAIPEDAEGLAHGDKLLIASKAFNPLIFKVGSGG